MPTISQFHGIVIRMYWADHAPPHFHAFYGGFEILIDILTRTAIRGSLPPAALKLVLEWASLHRAALLEDWTLCSQNQPAKPIAPLP